MGTAVKLGFRRFEHLRDVPRCPVIVRQRHSSIARPRNWRDTLRSLGVGRPHQVTVVDASRPSVRGMLHAVWDVIAVEPALAAAERGDANEVIVQRQADAGWGPDMTIDYLARGVPSRVFEFGDGSQLTWENHGSDFAMVWSSLLPAKMFIHRLESLGLMPEIGPEDTAVVLTRQGKRHVHMAAQEALNQVRRDGRRQVAFFRIDLATQGFSWKDGAGGQTMAASRDKPRVTEISYASTLFDADYCARLIHATATTELGEFARELVRDAIAEHAPGGNGR